MKNYEEVKRTAILLILYLDATLYEVFAWQLSDCEFRRYRLTTTFYSIGLATKWLRGLSLGGNNLIEYLIQSIPNRIEFNVCLPRNIGLATKWLRILTLGGNDPIE